LLKKKEIAETKRLFYVGLTRAKEHLIISFGSRESLKIQHGSFIWMLKKGLDVDFNKDFYRTQGKLTFLVNEGENYFNKDKIVSVNIPIYKDIQLINTLKSESPRLTKKNIRIRIIDDHLSGDIISATKFSVFSQCPMKYLLRYEVGLNLFDNDYSLFDRNVTEPENEFDGRLKGRIIHTLLEEEIDQKDLYDKTNIILDKEKISPDEKKKLLNNILLDLGEYYSAEKYKKINCFEKYKNEYEIYLKMDKYYLYGRIDKVIFGENEIKIIDYKTDNMIPRNIYAKNELHYSQVKFYSYILSNLFPQIQKFELRIVYIKNSDIDIQFKINKESFPAIEDEIKDMINSLQTGSYVSNSGHCKECIYSIDKTNCIKK